MARDDEDSATQPEAGAVLTEQVPETSTDSANVTEQTVTVPSENGTESPETPAEPAAEEKPAGPSAEDIAKAMEAFRTLATEVADTRDSATGEIPEAEQAKVKAAYVALPTTPSKTQSRNWLDTQMKSALAKDRDAAKARAYLTLAEAVKTQPAKADVIARAPVDPTQAHVDRVCAMYLSSSMVVTPDDVDPNWVERLKERGKELAPQCETYQAYLIKHEAWSAADEATRGDEPTAPENIDQVVVNAARIARGRTGTVRVPKAAKADGTPKTPKVPGVGYTGVRRDVKKHIRQAFASVAVGGFLKIGEISAFSSTEYGNDHPSSGAVSASLASPKFDVAGIQAAISPEGLHGARKVS